MNRNRLRLGVGMLAAMGIWFLLDRLVPSEATTLTVALTRMSLLAIVALAIGGFIAAKKFVVPSMVLAALIWIAVAAYSMYLGSSIGNPLWDHVVWNLPSTFLIPAVAIGAKIGTVAAANRARSTSA